MIKSFTTEDGVTHIVPKGAPIVMAAGDATTIAAPPPYSLERVANLPDYVLAEYLTQCLVAMNVALTTTQQER